MIIVKLVELGSEIKEYGLDDSSVLSDLLKAADKVFVSGNITRNNYELSVNSQLYSGDRVFIGKAMKGNLDPFEVDFIRIGGTSVLVAANDGQTIKEVIEQLNDEEQRKKFFRADGSAAYEFRVGGGKPVDENHVLERPMSGSVRIICSQRVKGN